MVDGVDDVLDAAHVPIDDAGVDEILQTGAWGGLEAEGMTTCTLCVVYVTIPIVVGVVIGFKLVTTFNALISCRFQAYGIQLETVYFVVFGK